MTAPALAHVTRRTRSPHVPAYAPWWLAGIVSVTMAGFQLKMRNGVAGLDLAHAVHGTAALGWSLLLVLQAWLAGQRRRELHRHFAVLGVMFAVAMVASSAPMLGALASGAVHSEMFRPIGSRLFVLDVLLLALFVMLFAVALANVRRPAVHARALAATGVLALPAGLGRAYMWAFNAGPMTGSWLALGTGMLVLGGVMLADRRAGVRDRVLPAVLGAFMLVVVITEGVADAPWVLDTMRRAAGA